MVETKKNPVINSDFPDPEIIRVDDTYYMASTTMHYMLLSGKLNDAPSGRLF